MKWRIAWLLLFTGNIMYGQQFHFRQYTVKDGLCSNRISDIVKDEHGFLWIATGSGLSRFDGNAFDNFYNDPADPHSLPSNEMHSLYIDTKKKLWTGSTGGISAYDASSHRFDSYYPDSSNGKCGRWFMTMLDDDQGRLWVGTWFELLIFDKKTKFFQRSGWADFAAHAKPAGGNNSRIVVLKLLKKSEEEMWVLTTYGLYSVNTHTRKFNWYPCNIVDDYYGTQISFDTDKNILWMGTYNKGILRFDIAHQSWQRTDPPPGWNSISDFNQAYGITPYRGDSLLFSSLDGLAFFNKNSGKFYRLPKMSISGDAVTGVKMFYMLKENNTCWMTSGDGLIKMSEQQAPFNQVTPFGKGSFINRVYPLKNDPASVVLYHTGRNEVVLWNEKISKAMVLAKAGNEVKENDITGWNQQSDSIAWISTEETVYRCNVKTYQSKQINIPPLPFPGNQMLIRNIIADKEGILWIRFRSQGILRYDPATETGSFINIVKPEADNSFPALYYNRSQNSLWLSVEHGGLFRYDISTKQTTDYTFKLSSHGNATINAITGDDKGNMYLGDASNGIYFYDVVSQNFTQLTKKDGLPSNNCNGLTRDETGKVWIATADGLCSYDPVEKSFFLFSAEPPFPKQVSFLAGDDAGNIYTCADSSYFRWQASSIIARKTDAVIYTRNMMVNGKNISPADHFSLNHDENNISFQFGSIISDDEGPVYFEYALNSETDWQQMENSNIIHFSNLAPGIYELKIRQRGNLRILHTSFEIKAPFWKRTWFLLLLISCIAVISFFLVNRRINNIRKQANMKQMIAETEMKALKAQMNPHFIFNCISSIDNFILGNDRENASAYLNKFAKLIRNILDNSKNDLVPFRKDWETMNLYLELEQLRGNEQFGFELVADEALLDGHYKIPPLIIQPYIENAIHHGLLQKNEKGGRLLIRAELKEEALHYTIRDNGIGREKAAVLKQFNRHSHHSYGMQLTEERIALFNRQQKSEVSITDLKDEHGNASGTLVEVILKV